MKIKKTTLPAGSLAEKYMPADYTDAFVWEVDSAREISPDDVMVAFWTEAVGGAGWVRGLFRLRNFLVRFVGLEGSGGWNPGEFEAAVRRGGTYRFASIAAKSPDETVMLLSDTHLDAYLLVHVAAAGVNTDAGTETETETETETSSGAGRRRRISAITLVHFKNRLGRIYFFIIRPFHTLIVKNMLARAVKKAIG